MKDDRSSAFACIQTRKFCTHYSVQELRFGLQKRESGVGYLVLELGWLSPLPFWLSALSGGRDAGSIFLLPHTTAFAK